MSAENPFASPKMASPFASGTRAPVDSAWRSGDLLVVSHRSQLPDRCVRCNGTAAGFKKKLNLSWHPQLVYAAILLGAIPYILFAVITQKRMTVLAGMCAEHRRRRRNGLLLGWLAVLGGIALLIGAAMAESGTVALVSVACIVVALGYLIVMARVVVPKRISHEFAWLKGVSSEYLAVLPEFVE